MTELFGQRVELDSDLAKDQRRDRLGWAIVVVALLSIVYDLSRGPASTEVFQGMFATIFPYGISFYVNQKRKQLGRTSLWKVVLATSPLHLLYLTGIFWSDKAFPDPMKKVLFFLPVLAVGAAIESIYLLDPIAKYFRSREVDQPSAPRMKA